ncbi:MAG TPA: Na(+)/H(+) antiporter subunit C [Clostridia bacterium]|nr:Na(+)/H(+) antiporter subunit C [Clostridia bacterium]
MELLMSIVIGILFALGIYLLLCRNMMRVVLGTALISHGTNLMLLTSGRLKRGISPFIPADGSTAAAFTDPIPQALILTAIVISFGTSAFLVAMAYRSYQELGTVDLNEVRGVEDE